MDLIDRQAAIDALERNSCNTQRAIDAVNALPSARPEIMPDGTLHVTVNADVANIDRILLSQAGTHSGDLYYRNDELKPEPHWIPCSKRLPETEEFVLASLTGKYRNTTFEHACEIADYADGEWCVYAYPHMSAEKCEELIEAWMPLPKPFEGGTE